MVILPFLLFLLLLFSPCSSFKCFVKRREDSLLHKTDCKRNSCWRIGFDDGTSEHGCGLKCSALDKPCQEVGTTTVCCCDEELCNHSPARLSPWSIAIAPLLMLR